VAPLKMGAAEIRRAARGAVTLLILAFALVGRAPAQSAWLESGDVGLRMDLTLLNDAEVIRLPVSHWPVPRAAVEYAVSNAKPHLALNTAVKAALDRVRARLAGAPGWSFSAHASAGEVARLRTFGTTAREAGELGGGVSFASGRISGELKASIVADPDDGQQVRLDGSDLTLQWGNWLLSANTLDRFWGPSHESSLILSNNARPMPTFALERAEARPFESRWLDWLGPWRFSLGVSRMESERADIDAPLFLAWRVTVMPLKDVELGFTRTAQFCGEQLACDFSSITEMLIGNDNVGIDASAENEPGNQMAGFDIRWASPIGNWPYAIYSQMIGEDESGYLPVKYLEQFGVETWKPLRDGGLVQGYLEYADTTCSASRSNPRFNCAYNQGRFNVEGYRYRGRVIGHTTDRDSESWAMGVNLTTARGDVWTAAARYSDLNRDPAFDPTDTLSPGPAEYAAVDVGWRRDWRQHRFTVGLGAESFRPQDMDNEVEAYGIASWSYQFSP
jgi:hypothetical protein